jgi:hypothetical protein
MCTYVYKDKYSYMYEHLYLYCIFKKSLNLLFNLYLH